MDVCNINLTPCCHISFPHIIGVAPLIDGSSRGCITLNIVFSVIYYLELQNIVFVYYLCKFCYQVRRFRLQSNLVSSRYLQNRGLELFQLVN